MNVLIQIFLLFLLILLNAFFVASEIVLISLRKTQVDELIQKGNPSARMLSNALSHLDSFISATQLGVTIVSLLLGWIGESVLAGNLASYFSFLPKGPALVFAHTAAFVVAFLFITYIQIVLGELVPKALALQKTEYLSMFLIFPLTIFARVFHPFISVLNTSAQIVLRLLRMNGSTYAKLDYTSDEIHLLLDQFRRTGALPKAEVDMIQNVIRLQDIPIKKIMIPRMDIVAFEETTTCKMVLKQIERFGHSRYPVYRRTIDNIVGFVHVKDIYKAVFKGDGDVKLARSTIIRKIIYIPDMKKADDVLLDMRKKHIHLSVVDDEYGQTAGIVSLEDIIESLVGEIQDEFDKPIREITRQVDGSFLIDGRASLESLQKRFNIPIRGLGYNTVGGLVFSLLGREPKVNDRVQLGSLIFEVEEIDGKRVKTVRLRRDVIRIIENN
jgi:putative hemolysin